MSQSYFTIEWYSNDDRGPSFHDKYTAKMKRRKDGKMGKERLTERQLHSNQVLELLWL